MLFLAIDTVFEHCAVAISDDRGRCLYSQTQPSQRQQSQQILPMIDAALQALAIAPTMLTALVFNRGPGGFSGIRINTAVVQALSVAWDVPCVGVSSLQTLAQWAFWHYDERQVSAVIDARMQQVYVGDYYYQQGIMQADSQSAERLLDYGQCTHTAWPLIGAAATLLTLQASQTQITAHLDNADTLAWLGSQIYQFEGGVEAEQALPTYLRHHAWKTLAQQQQQKQQPLPSVSNQH